MYCNTEIGGCSRMVLYVNKDIKYIRPDINKEDEVNLITSAKGAIVINRSEGIKYSRTIDYSSGYVPMYVDEFKFSLSGIFQSNAQELINNICKNMHGYIVELKTLDNKSYVFPTPVFLKEPSKKEEDGNDFNVFLSYRVPTYKTFLKKLNNIAFVHSYIVVDNSSILGYKNTAIVSK